MRDVSHYDNDDKLKLFLLAHLHLRGIRKGHPLHSRIMDYANKHNLYHPETTLQTYIYYIRNNIKEISHCKTCNVLIPNLAQGRDKLKKYCSNKCQGIDERKKGYKPALVPRELSDGELIAELSARETFKNISKSSDMISRVNGYIAQNTKFNLNVLTNAEKVHIIKRNLKEPPICMNCSSPISIAPIYNYNENRKTVYQRFCSDCTKRTSSYEYLVRGLIDKMGIVYDPNKRDILGNGKELDIFIPSKNIGIEINGLFWHCEKQNSYDKLMDCDQKGIRLLQIYTDELDESLKKVYYRLRSIIGAVKYDIWARKCVVKEIGTKTKNAFLSKYHLQGADKASYSFGLFYKDRLVAVMTFARPRINMGKKKTSNTEWELSRFATINSFRVVGAAGKLLKHFISVSNSTRIYSYCDLRWSNGNVYEKIGFKFVKNTTPNYWYVLSPNYTKRYYRFNFRKSVLKDKLKKFDPSLSEVKNMENNGHYRIFDSGHKLYELNLK